MSNFIIQSYRIQAFNENEILMNIKPEILQGILQKDEHPFFQTYVIAHEGQSRPNVIGIGGKIVNWSRAAVQTFKNVIKNGIKGFKNHNKDNSVNNRKIYGEIVGYIEREIDGKLNIIAITYHSPDVREEAKNFDVVSQEGEWSMEENNDGSLNAISCDELTALAFSNSKENQPAFAGAKRIGMIQCFEDDKKEVKPMTFSELKKACEELNVWPSQLFNLDKIKQDNNFSEIFKKYESDLLEKTNESVKFKHDFETANNKLKDIETQTQKITAKDRLEKIVKEKNISLTDNEKKFIFATIERNNDFSDEGLIKFLSSRQEDYKEFAKINNFKDNKMPETEKQKDDNPNTDYTDPKNNDLLT